jgi:hypothetical protein
MVGRCALPWLPILQLSKFARELDYAFRPSPRGGLAVISRACGGACDWAQLVRRWRWHSPSPALAGAALGVAIRDTTISNGAKIAVSAGFDPSARRLAIELAPASTAPKLHACEQRPLCPPTSTWPVRPPLRVIGWISFKHTHGPHWTSVRLRHVQPGRYKIFALWRSPHPPGQPYLLFAASRYRARRTPRRQPTQRGDAPDHPIT